MGAYSGPEINESGLILCLDAGNTKSYPGSGTTWFDLSGNGNNGSLVNMDGANLDSANGGSLTFDGSNEFSNHPYASLLNLGTQFTISAFVKFNPLTQEIFPIFSAPDIDLNVYTEGYLFYLNKQSGYAMDANTLRLQFGKNSWSWNVYASNGLTINDNNWHFVSVTASALDTSSPTIRFYIDGNSITGTFWNSTIKSPIRYSSNINSPRVASYYFPSSTSPSYYNPIYGDLNISNVSVYNKALSASEVKQNFNAFRGRFGL